MAYTFRNVKTIKGFKKNINDFIKKHGQVGQWLLSEQSGIYSVSLTKSTFDWEGGTKITITKEIFEDVKPVYIESHHVRTKEGKFEFSSEKKKTAGEAIKVYSRGERIGNLLKDL